MTRKFHMSITGLACLRSIEAMQRQGLTEQEIVESFTAKRNATLDEVKNELRKVGDKPLPHRSCDNWDPERGCLGHTKHRALGANKKEDKR